MGLWETLMAAMPQQSLGSLYASLFPEDKYARRSENVEDRRRTPFVPTPGTFGDGINTGNVFEGGGLLKGLKQGDFASEGMAPPAGLSVDAGALDIMRR